MGFNVKNRNINSMSKFIGISIFLVPLVFSILAFRNYDNGAYTIGDTVEDFTLTNYDGSMISLSGYNNAKGLIIVFTGNQCPFDQAYESRLIDLDRKYRADGFILLAINPNDAGMSAVDNLEAIRARAQQKSFTFPFLFDESGSLRRKFGVVRSPHAFVLDGARKIVYSGAIDDSVTEPEKIRSRYVEEAIIALKEGKSIVKPLTKPVGCTVKADF